MGGIQRTSSSVSPPHPVKSNHISFADECDQQSRAKQNSKQYASFVDVTDVKGAHVRNEEYLQPGSANHRLKVQPTAPEKSSLSSNSAAQRSSRAKKLDNKFISLQNQNSPPSSKETYL